MEKDWTGNRRSVFSMMGASNHSETERQSEDFYATDPAVLDHLSRKYTIPNVVLEPACGEGHLSKWLEDHGHKVYSSDLMDRGYGEQQNFFEMITIPEDCYCILTNPPYKHATEFVIHSLELLQHGGQVVMFLKTTFLETERRYNDIFKTTPPKYVYQFIRRAMCAKNADFEEARKMGSAVSYAFFIWEKGYKGPTTLDWI
jgi:hypothetical protein